MLLKENDMEFVNWIIQNSHWIAIIGFVLLLVCAFLEGITKGAVEKAIEQTKELEERK